MSDEQVQWSISFNGGIFGEKQENFNVELLDLKDKQHIFDEKFEQISGKQEEISQRMADANQYLPRVEGRIAIRYHKKLNQGIQTGGTNHD